MEVGGRGGVFQHAAAVAESLANLGLEVKLHTATDAEYEIPGVDICRCMRWFREMYRPVRRPCIMISYLTRTVPHVVRSVGRRDVVHIQGVFGYELTEILIRLLRRRVVAFTPHNSFARGGKRHHARSLKSMIRLADVVFATTDSDERLLKESNQKVARVELVLKYPEPSELDIAAWRQRFGTGPTALLAGQLRADKRPDVFLEACKYAGFIPVVVGPDHDGAGLLAEAESRLEIRAKRFGGYLDLKEFVAAIAAADVVVASHRQASGSGPIALAAELGVRCASFDVGGLGEVASAVATGETGLELGEAIVRAYNSPKPAQAAWRSSTGHETLRGYQMAGGFGSG